MDLQNLNIARIATATSHNSKFAQKWLTVVQLGFFVNYLVQCGLTSVLQVMPFMRKFSKRYRQMFPERNASLNESFRNASGQISELKKSI